MSKITPEIKADPVQLLKMQLEAAQVRNAIVTEQLKWLHADSVLINQLKSRTMGNREFEEFMDYNATVDSFLNASEVAVAHGFRESAVRDLILLIEDATCLENLKARVRERRAFFIRGVY